jgi:hypothetical protein
MTGMRNFEFAANRNGSHLARQRLKEERLSFDQPRRIHVRADIPQGNLQHNQYREPVYAKGTRQFLRRAAVLFVRLGNSVCPRHADRPGLSGLGHPCPFKGFNSHWPQDNRIGPQLFGTVSNFGPGTLKWNALILFGVTSASPRETTRWQLESEIHF